MGGLAMGDTHFYMEIIRDKDMTQAHEPLIENYFTDSTIKSMWVA